VTAASADGHTQARLGSLVEVNRSIVAELSLSALLRRIVEAARTVAHAEYAALGVLGPDGQLEQFVHSGMTKDVVAAIGELPRGRGVLGALISDPRPIRIRSIGDHPRSSGFPPAHPPMGSFLGVPIQSRGEIYGNLYLTNRCDANEFSAQDEELVVAIAATAGVAIENARLYEESRRQQEWLRASADVSRELLLESTTATQILTHVADTVRRLAAADVVSVVFPGAAAAELTVQIARGHQARELLGYTYPAAGSLAGEVMITGRARLLNPDHGGYFVHLQSVFDVGPVMACPLVGEAGVRAAVMVGRRTGSVAFTDADLKTAETFTNHAAIGLELADRREGRRRVEVLEDRARIARDLHDHVIQRLFATGLTIQAAAVRAADPVLTAKLEAAVDDLDDTIRQIRTSIFQLQDQTSDGAGGPRAALIDVVASVEPALGLVPNLTFVGPIDTLIRPDVLDDAEAVVREGLTNIAKHADATRVDISVSASARHMAIEIADNGSTAPSGDRRSGLANLERRAQLRRGACTFLHDQHGTRLRWTAAIGD
jgi:signal transduction histidine kinase